MDCFKVLYIDPGTGGMLFTILFGLIGVVVFAFRTVLMKLKFRLSGGKASKINDQKIPIAIYTDHKRYWNVFEPLLDEFEKRHQKVVYLTGSEDDPIFEKKYEYISGKFIGEGNKGFSKLNLLNATIVISSTPSLDIFQWKRSKNVDYYIHIPHAPNDITLYRMFGVDDYDALILSGKYQEEEIRQLEKLREYSPKDIALCGLPFMDEMKKRLDNAEQLPPHDRTVLLAPSWGESSIRSKYGEPFIDALISTGVMFDFSLVFDKPVIYTRSFFDVSPYDAAWIDDELWMYKILPSIGLELNEENIGDIKKLIDKCIDDPSFAAGRDKARAETWVHMGEGAKRSVDFIMEKYNEVIAKKEKEMIKDVTPAKRKTKKIILKGS